MNRVLSKSQTIGAHKLGPSLVIDIGTCKDHIDSNSAWQNVAENIPCSSLFGQCHSV